MRRTIIKIVGVLLVLISTAASVPLSAEALLMAPPPKHTPVLIVPGITGTEIYKGTELLWPDVLRMVDPLNSDNFMDPLAFDQNLKPVDSNLTPGSVIGIIKPIVSTATFNFDYADGLIQQLKLEGYQENVDIFTFPYDWRFGVSRNAQFLQGAVQQVIKQTNSSAVDIVAHSNGGLIVKKYVMDNPNPQINKVVFVGTPNLGAPAAAKTLLAGDSLGIPGLSDGEMQKLAHNMPAMYDLLPSAEYINRSGSYFSINTRKNLFSTTSQNLDYNQTTNYLANDKGLNKLGIKQAELFHTLAYDNFDVRDKGVDAYNIVGCNSGTPSQIIERKAQPAIPLVNGYALKYGPGDGTVPLVSASSILADSQNKVFYATNTVHAKMLGADGTRQEIVKILSGDAGLVPGPSVRQDTSQCKLNGKVVSIFSPVNIEVLDSQGNRAGLLSDGSIENDIPNAHLDIVGEHKFVYLPDTGTQSYTVNLTGSGNGTFTVTVDVILNNEITTTSSYYNLPVTVKSAGQLSLAGDTSLSFDKTSYSPDTVAPKHGKKKHSARWLLRHNQNNQDKKRK